MKNNLVLINKIRNILIFAHIDGGKTTTTEAMLCVTGAIHKMGIVHEGTTVTDYDPQERERGITINSATIATEWNDHRIAIIDTPGHIDFTIEVERAMRVTDGGVLVLCGVGGVQPQTETVCQQAKKYGVPSVVFINKMDRDGADFERVVAEIRDELHIEPIVLIVPHVVLEHSLPVFKGYINILNGFYHNCQSGEEYELFAELKDIYAVYLERLCEQIAIIDETILDDYANECLDRDKIISAIRQLTLARTHVPVTCGSALNNIGIPELLDSIVNYLPSPEDRIVKDMSGKIILKDAGVSAFVFKTIVDKFVGTFDLLRVYSGRLRVGDILINGSRHNEKERVGKMYILRANPEDRDIIQEAHAGDIVAVTGLKNVRTGDTLSSDGLIVYEALDIAPPLISIAIEPQSSKDLSRLNDALIKVHRENPSIRFNMNNSQLILSGVGQLALEVVIRNLKDKYNIEVNSGIPMIEYREKPKGDTNLFYTLVKQTGGRGMYAGVHLQVISLETTGLVEPIVEFKIAGGAIKKSYFTGIENGIREACRTGFKYGYPCMDLRVEVIDGKMHEVDSSDMAFKLATMECMKAMMKTVQVHLLEPIFDVNIVVPNEYSSMVQGDAMSRRGVIVNVDRSIKYTEIQTDIPLAELFDYITILRTLTQGRGTATMALKNYLIVSDSVLQKIEV